MAVKFELTDIPTELSLKEATLGLFYLKGTKGIEKSTVYPLTSSWVDTAATWKLKDESLPWEQVGGEYDNSISAEAPYATEAGWEEFNVTAIVNTWLSGTENHGFFMMPDRADGHTGREYCASEYEAQIEYRPKLTLLFTDDVATKNHISLHNQNMIIQNQERALTLLSKEMDADVTIYNSLGKEMFQKRIEKGINHTVDFAEFGTGIFIVRVVNAKGVLHQTLFMK